MPQRKQPRTLQTICQECITSHLAVTCRKLQSAAQDGAAAQVLSLAKKQLRPLYLATLPGSIRTDLLREASRLLSSPPPDGSSSPGAGPAPLYLLTLLLAPDVKSLRIELCCYYGCSHQAALLRLLAQEGTGLRSLEIARTALLRLDKALLRSALTAAPSLRKLVMRNIASDSILQVIGASCPSLEVLDVAHSRQVTDNGVRDLLVSVELKDKVGNQEQPQKSPVHRWAKLRMLAKFVPWMKNENSDKQRKVLLHYCERRNNLCSSLHTLDISNTGVSTAGVLLALNHAPGLQSFGDYAHTVTALEALDKTPVNHQESHNNRFNLIAARTARITQHRLEVMTHYCPELRALVLDEPRLPATALQSLPKNLSILAIHSAPNNALWLSCLYSHLKTNGHTLMELTLRFSFVNPNEVPRPANVLDLTQVANSCPQLRTLIVDGLNVAWESDQGISFSDKKPMPNLKVAHLGRIVSAQAISRLLRCAPDLRVMHIFCCLDLQDRDLRHLVPHMKKLECFYIYEARQVKTLSAVNALISSCGQLSKLGNLGSWGLDCESTRAVYSQINGGQLQLELLGGSHWFNSPCIHTT
ncbi:uncharacterized protein LOC132194339 [Neocloeon triangulifer]|uniref:uncharacterized protein LOC132194339 n=1 Tax=Neocloeon triangulifer TaxID=2078957 RepID=UPI00286FA112|nr:uncharacterized protein LOC132194339 [Neocloeon triangulifer]